MRRPAVACIVLLAVYFGLSCFNDERGYLGTDTGGKVATLRVMEERSTLDPDVGYWARRWDPNASLHPLYYTFERGDKLINVSTLPALMAAYPLWRVGGYRATLLLPMLGAMFAALAARALARRLGAQEQTAWWAFWLTGLASPLTIYALDFWEHSIGVALTAWGIVFLLDLVEHGRLSWRAPAAGLLFGVAGMMRTDTLVYAAVATAIACGILLRHRTKIGQVLLAGFLVTGGLAVALVANEGLERAVLGEGLRSSRAADTAANAITAATSRAVPSRFTEARVTLFNLQPSLDTTATMIGILLFALAAYALARSRSDGGQRLAAIAAAAIGGLYLLRSSEGLGFVPGLLAAAPLAVVGVLRGGTRRSHRVVLGLAVVAMPVVWRFQYRGGAVPQWGGRYLLVSSFLLSVVGVLMLPDLRRWLRIGAVALAIGITGFGVAWLSQRSHDISETMQALDRRDQALVSTVGHLFREGGAFYQPGKHWLTAIGREELAAAADVLEKAGEHDFGLVQLPETRSTPSVPGWRPVGEDVVPFFGGDMRVTTYERRP